MIEGRIEAVTGRIASGWVLPNDGARSVMLDFYLDGQPLGTTVAFPAMGAIGGRLIFEVPLPAASFDGEVHLIACAAGTERVVLAQERQTLAAVSEVATQAVIDGREPFETVQTPRPAPAPAKPTAFAEGRLDTVSEKGWCFGWAWYPQIPGERVEVEFLVDGEVVGVALATNPRPDVAAAGHGDGMCGFTFPLPYKVLTRPRDGVVVARDRRSGTPLPDPVSFKSRKVADAVQQITALEQELSAVTAALETPPAAAADARAAALFRTVGAFFTALAITAESGRDPASLRLLDGAVAAAVGAYPVVALVRHEHPLVTVGLHADAALGGLYEALGRIEPCLQAPAEIFLLDDGSGGDAPLAPLVVQNLRYLRQAGSAVARVNLLCRLAEGPVVLLLPASAILRAGAAATLFSFAEDESLAMLAARITGPDGALLSAGIALTQGGPAPRGRGAPKADIARATTVDAPAAEAFALRLQSWSQLGGLDESYATLGPALADFALRAAAIGQTVGYDPGFAVTLGTPPAATTGPAIAAARADLARLDERRRSPGQAA